MVDVTLQHLLLAQFLAFVLLRVVVVILLHHRATTVMAQMRSCDRRPFQIAAQVFYAAPGTAALFGEVDLPVALILRLQIAFPLLLIAKVAMTGQGSRVNTVIAGPQQTDNGRWLQPAVFFEEQVAPDAVFDIEAATDN